MFYNFYLLAFLYGVVSTVFSVPCLVSIPQRSSNRTSCSSSSGEHVGSSCVVTSTLDIVGGLVGICLGIFFAIFTAYADIRRPAQSIARVEQSIEVQEEEELLGSPEDNLSNSEKSHSKKPEGES